MYPATYIAALYRQVLMKEAVSEAFKGEMIFFENFKKNGRSAQMASLIDKGTNIPYSVRVVFF